MDYSYILIEKALKTLHFLSQLTKHSISKKYFPQKTNRPSSDGRFFVHLPLQSGGLCDKVT